jgi:hypothetical protein
MIRLNIIVEGHTEERFVKEVLSVHLALFQVYAVARKVETSRHGKKLYKGGITTYAKLKNDFHRWMKHDNSSNVRFTSMFDLYGLPKDFPGFQQSITMNNPYQKVEYLENSFAKDIQDSRFIPYIQLHEYEALILSKPQSLKKIFLEHDKQINTLVELTKSFSTPELIDDGFDTSPSKRIIQQIPSYRFVKSSAGPSAKDIGLETIRKKCPHFGNWLHQLENLSAEINF